MANQENSSKSDKTTLSSTDSKKSMENHKTAAKHLTDAAKHHMDASKHHEDGNHEKAAESTVKAHGYTSLANDAQKENVKNHASTK